ncbi:hypothetical protein ACJX0J_026209, partial [Zea mays]
IIAYLMPLRRIHACKDPNSAPRQRFSRVVVVASEGRGRRRFRRRPFVDLPSIRMICPLAAKSTALCASTVAGHHRGPQASALREEKKAVW